MSTGGYGQGGASGAGPSKMFLSLPYKGWREVATWVEELIDSLGYRLDVLNNRFISTSARTALLDPTNADPNSATNYFATATQAPLLSSSTDSMLDVLLYAALGLSDADSNLSVEQKQALASVGADALKEKGTRLQLLNVASKLSEGVAQGWTVPPNNFSIIFPDGAPSPGWGEWVPLGGPGMQAVFRPWILPATRQVTAALTPAHVQLGVGYSQFRAGYSTAGETVFPVGTRINIFANEHFSTWSAGLPTVWSPIASGGASTANIIEETGDSFTNWEFTGSSVFIDLSTTNVGGVLGLSSPFVAVNNQLTHRFQLDYRYSNAQNVGTLCVNIIASNNDGSQPYWNNETQAWQATPFNIVVPQTNDERARFACDVIPQTSDGALRTGTQSINVRIFVTSDGTATTKTFYLLYRVGLYEKTDIDNERSSIVGERTAWYPLIDAPGVTSSGRDNPTTVQLEMANAKRSSYRVNQDNAIAFDYHPAISGQGFRAHTAWVNLLRGSNAFSTDWSRTNLNFTANSVISPEVGAIFPTAPLLTGTAFLAGIGQGGLVDPSNKSYVGGVWVKKITADVNEAGTLAITQGSTTVTGSGTSFLSVLVAGCQIRTTAGNIYTVASITNNVSFQLAAAAPRSESGVNWAVSDFFFQLNGTVSKNVVAAFVSQSEGWKLIPIVGNFVAAEVTLQFSCQALSSPSSIQFSLASAYVYESTGKKVLYPPVCRTPVGSTATLGATHCVPITAGPGVNVLHPLTRRTLGSVVRGSLNMTVAPTWDGEGNPAGGAILFDLAQGDNANRVVLALGPSAITLVRKDNAGLTWSVSLNAIYQSILATDVAWRRDTKIEIRCIWDENSVSLSANEGSITSTAKPVGWNVLDPPVLRISIGGFATSKAFDGIIQNVELGVIGAPVS